MPEQEPLDLAERPAPGPPLALGHEIWGAYRPYLVRFAVDFLVSGTLWLTLFLFKALTNLLAVPAAVGEFIVFLHGAGVVLAFAIFAALFVNDIYAIHRREKRGER